MANDEGGVDAGGVAAVLGAAGPFFCCFFLELLGAVFAEEGTAGDTTGAVLEGCVGGVDFAAGVGVACSFVVRKGVRE